MEFYRRHQGGLYRFALHMCGRPESAADVVQETFLTLIRQSGKFDQEKGTPAAFLYGIARNHFRKLHEKESRYVPLFEELGKGISARIGSRGRQDTPTGMAIPPQIQVQRRLSGGPGTRAKLRNCCEMLY